ncbi:MAG: GntR family transcriptional regulator [Lachnospiraceae bacterium]
MIQLDYKDRRPLYEQVAERFKELILTGVLQPDEKIPSVRSMAIELSVTPNTIQRAYSELEKAGYIYTVTGRGNFVSDGTTLQDIHLQQLLGQVRSAISQAKNAGISRDEILETLELIYGGITYDTD